MIVDALVRIRAIERSLRDVVMPAIDPARKNALEQAEYMARHLQMLLQHAESEYTFALTELRDCAELTKTLLHVVPDARSRAYVEAQRVLAESESLVGVQVPALSDVKRRVGQLRESSDALLRQAMSGAPGIQQAASAAVLENARTREQRDTAWVSRQVS